MDCENKNKYRNTIIDMLQKQFGTKQKQGKMQNFLKENPDRIEIEEGGKRE